MNERIEAYLKQHHCRDYFNCYGEAVDDEHYFMYREEVQGLIELITQDMYRKVIASILITDVVMEETGCEPTSEDYILAIKKDFGIEL